MIRISIVCALLGLSLASPLGYTQGTVQNTQQSYSGQVQGRSQVVADESPMPYQFSYDFVDEDGAQQSRSEVADGSGKIEGSYGYQNADGIKRQVRYFADDGGFRAVIDTNEPGTDNKNPANVEFNANPVQVPQAAVQGRSNYQTQQQTGNSYGNRQQKVRTTNVGSYQQTSQHSGIGQTSSSLNSGAFQQRKVFQTQPGYQQQNSGRLQLRSGSSGLGTHRQSGTTGTGSYQTRQTYQQSSGNLKLRGGSSSLGTHQQSSGNLQHSGSTGTGSYGQQNVVQTRPGYQQTSSNLQVRNSATGSGYQQRQTSGNLGFGSGSSISSGSYQQRQVAQTQPSHQQNTGSFKLRSFESTKKSGY